MIQSNENLCHSLGHLGDPERDGARWYHWKGRRVSLFIDDKGSEAAKTRRQTKAPANEAEIDISASRPSLLIKWPFNHDNSVFTGDPSQVEAIRSHKINRKVRPENVSARALPCQQIWPWPTASWQMKGNLWCFGKHLKSFFCERAKLDKLRCQLRLWAPYPPQPIHPSAHTFYSSVCWINLLRKHFRTKARKKVGTNERIQL